MVNREDQNVVIGTPAENFDPVKGTLNRVERLIENLVGQLLHRVFTSLDRGKLAETKVGFAVLANHLHWTFFSRQE